MKKCFSGVLAALLLTAPVSARADIIEIRGEGYVNGDILSDDAKEVKFKDNHGNVRRIPKTDVLYLQKEERTVAVKSDLWKKVKDSATDVKNTADAWTKKITGPLTAPLDRSAADKKSQMLNDVLEQANQASAASAAKAKTINREIYRQQNEAREEAKSSEEKPGRFTKL